MDFPPEWASSRGRAGHPGCPVYVAKSKLEKAGYGVFCSIDLPQNAHVTTYDGHFTRDIPPALIDYAIEVDIRRSPRLRRDDHTQQNGMYLVAEPRVIHGKGYGHLLNDAIHPEVTGHANNCEFVYRRYNTVYIVTTRAIPAHTELTASYHVQYWAGRCSYALPKNVCDFCNAMRIVQSYLHREHGAVLEDYIGDGVYEMLTADGRLVTAPIMLDDASGDVVVDQPFVVDAVSLL